MQYFGVNVSFLWCGKEELNQGQPTVLLVCPLLSSWLYPAEPNLLQNMNLRAIPSENDPVQVHKHVRVQIIISQEADRSDICWKHRYILLSCHALLHTWWGWAPLYADFTLQMLFCWDCQLQIACGNTSSMQQINIYNIIAHPCYCHNCKQLIKGMYLLCLRVIHSSNIFSVFKPIDFMEHLTLFHWVIIAYCVII